MTVPKNLPYNLVQLNLSHNSLTEIDVADFVNCSNLRKLTLHHNRIEHIINSEVGTYVENLILMKISMQKLTKVFIQIFMLINLSVLCKATKSSYH